MDYKEKQHKLWAKHLQLGISLLNKGIVFSKSGEIEHFDSMLPFREEVATGVKYLYRGYYCPSPIQEFAVGNVKRGKLLSRPTKRSVISNRYYYDSDNKLIMADGFLDTDSATREYLVYDGDTRYGFCFSQNNSLTNVIKEVYLDNLIRQYMNVNCYNIYSEVEKTNISFIHYEEFHYDDEGLRDIDWYYVLPDESYPAPPSNIDAAMGYTKHRFIREDGYLTGYYVMDCIDPIEPENPSIYKIIPTLKAQ